jgi:hypothetical protein
LFLAASLFWFFDFGSRMASGVSQEALLQLRPGMTEAEILTVLGEPLSKEKSPFPDTWSWSYGTPNPLTGGGFEIGVNLTSGRLESAGVEHYDLGVFWCRRGECPVIWDRPKFHRLPSRRPTVAVPDATLQPGSIYSGSAGGAMDTN